MEMEQIPSYTWPSAQRHFYNFAGVLQRNLLYNIYDWNSPFSF